MSLGISSLRTGYCVLTSENKSERKGSCSFFAAGLETIRKMSPPPSFRIRLIASAVMNWEARTRSVSLSLESLS